MKVPRTPQRIPPQVADPLPVTRAQILADRHPRIPGAPTSYDAWLALDPNGGLFVKMTGGTPTLTWVTSSGSSSSQTADPRELRKLVRAIAAPLGLTIAD